MRCLGLLVAIASLTLAPLRGEDVVFAAYNLQNYAPLKITGLERVYKSAESADVLHGILKKLRPDILGVCEMGEAPQFEEFQRRLAADGLPFRDFELVEAADPERRLALASRFPIVSRQSRTNLFFNANGFRSRMRRGILDVTVRIQPGFELRIVGVHLKSKRSNGNDTSAERREEAHLLRRHIDEILKRDPQTRLLVFGDFNETKGQNPILEIKGPRGGPAALRDIYLRDNVGDRWTQYWAAEDVYSRVDYIFVSPALWPFVRLEKSFIDRDKNWFQASDHRPLILTLRIP